MIDDTVKEILRAARDAVSLDELSELRKRVDRDLEDCRVGAGFACVVAIGVREHAILDKYRFDIANEAS
jgi:hypothetical protein